MCLVSNMGDHYGDKWNPWKNSQSPFNPYPGTGSAGAPLQDFHTMEEWAKILKPPVSRDEYEALKKEVEEMRRILKIAAEYDKKTGQPHCEMEEKVALLKAIAKMFGVDLSDIFKEGDNESNCSIPASK